MLVHGTCQLFDAQRVECFESKNVSLTRRSNSMNSSHSFVMLGKSTPNTPVVQKQLQLVFISALIKHCLDFPCDSDGSTRARPHVVSFVHAHSIFVCKRCKKNV